ncbi:MAG: hypothetical protein FJ224_08645 [Lentisphaerae bacterium]|nr:hypothetical protein [Lentisphaerota bacterium]
MDAFWKWLMRTNARAVLLAALLALLAVLAFWMWMLSKPVEISTFKASASSRPRVRGPMTVLAYMNEQAAANKAPERNPFVAARSHSVRPPIGDPFAGAPQQPRVAAGTATAVKPAEAPVKPPSVKRIKLTYRGIIKSSDGRLMVLIEDSESKGASFHDAAGSVFGMSVSSAMAETLDLLGADGAALTLKRGETVEIDAP